MLIVFSIIIAKIMIPITLKQNLIKANLLPSWVISNNIIGILVVDQAPIKIKTLVKETPFFKNTLAIGKEAYKGPAEKEPRIKANNPL